MAIEFKVVNTPRHDRFEETICKLLHGSPFISQTGGMTQALLRETKASVVKKPVKVVNSEK